MVEHLLCKQGVAGSNPANSTGLLLTEVERGAHEASLRREMLFFDMMNVSVDNKGNHRVAAPEYISDVRVHSVDLVSAVMHRFTRGARKTISVKLRRAYGGCLGTSRR